MKLSTALFGSVLAICCTAGLVSGQVKFADGTEQTTAFTGRTTAPPGKAFHVYIPSIYIDAPSQYKLSDPVPSGQELVILHTEGGNHYLSSRIGGNNPKYLTPPLNSTGGSSSTIVKAYPDGTVIIDEGREL